LTNKERTTLRQGGEKVFDKYREATRWRQRGEKVIDKEGGRT